MQSEEVHQPAMKAYLKLSSKPSWKENLTIRTAKKITYFPSCNRPKVNGLSVK